MTAITKAQAAVLIIDVQVGLFCVTPAPYKADEVIARINTVAAKARAAGVPVIFIQNDGAPQGIGWCPTPLDGNYIPNCSVLRVTQLFASVLATLFTVPILNEPCMSGEFKSWC